MERMRRRLATFASAFSPLLCAASAVLWARSFRWNTFVAYDATVTAGGVQWQYYVDTYEGTLHFARLMNADRASQLTGGRFRFFNGRIASWSNSTGARYWATSGVGYRYQH